jgi:hypothetical protein
VQAACAQSLADGERTIRAAIAALPDGVSRYADARSPARSRPGGERMWARMTQYDWAGRRADRLSPQTSPEWE